MAWQLLPEGPQGQGHAWLLRRAVEDGRGQHYFLSNPTGGRRGRVGRRRSAGLPICRQGAPAHHAQPADAQPGGSGPQPGARGRWLRRAAGSGVVPVSAHGTIRRKSTSADRATPAQPLAGGIPVSPPVLAYTGGRRPDRRDGRGNGPRGWRGGTRSAGPRLIRLPAAATRNILAAAAERVEPANRGLPAGRP